MIQCPQNSFFQKGTSHVTLNIHPLIPPQTAAALAKALAAVFMTASILLTGCAPAGGPDSPPLSRSQAVILRLAAWEHPRKSLNR